MANESEPKLKKVPSCRYTKGVGCPYENRKCYNCGFDPDVSYERIRKKYGKQYTVWLSEPEKRG